MTTSLYPPVPAWRQTRREASVGQPGPLTLADLAPPGALIVGVSWRITAAFDAVTGLTIGDAVCADRWGVATATARGTGSGSPAWHGQPGFLTPVAYTVLAVPRGGPFGATGTLRVVCTWLPPLAPPPED